MQPVATFSIVAYDSGRQEWGVAVQSKFLAVGAIVPWAEAGVGAVATQSHANVTYGSRGLQMMREGQSAKDTVDALIRADPNRDFRQLGIVDQNGGVAAYTGSACLDWAGQITGERYTCQGNILFPGTVEAMAECFESQRKGPGELSDWLVEALVAGQEAGGDSRGRQAAGVLVVRKNGGYGDDNDRYLDLRIDDDPYPIQKLKKLLKIHHLYFGKTQPEDLLPIEDAVDELQTILKKTGHYSEEPTHIFDETTQQALMELVSIENLEERWNGDVKMIDKNVLEYLRNKFL